MTNFFIGLTFPMLLAGVGLGATFFVFSGLNVLAFLFVKKFIPETKGCSLEELEKDFRSYKSETEIFSAEK